ncbi:hypothetical protein K432DRAFT_57634 [Lepidopterella palustris CBS 459.81]|uniref:Uncharacterized protein n=1 Tax=Lepidopterella palustris CBS 459.81 TaxID=1314670 RepID=A0A8E2E9R6_9PEZI|nr:hypothetical protein K432DRAFT_57634 [Lepidopterella palustris CBS 459.81]
MSDNPLSPPSLLPSPFPNDHIASPSEPLPSSEPFLSPNSQNHLQDGHQPEDACDTEPTYIEPTSETLLPPPNFSPFYTLIEDTLTGEHYNPSVHYVFADDDPIIVTAASIRALGVDDAAILSTSNGNETPERLRNEDGETIARESPLPAPQSGVIERYLLLDVGADGQTIVDAQSFSAEWQVTWTHVRPAPSWDEEAGGEGFMVMVKGVEVPQGKQRSGTPGEMKLQEEKAKTGGDVFTAMEEILGKFEKDNEALMKIVGESELDQEQGKQ